jgi:hypothetical protein
MMHTQHDTTNQTKGEAMPKYYVSITLEIEAVSKAAAGRVAGLVAFTALERHPEAITNYSIGDVERDEPFVMFER